VPLMVRSLSTRGLPKPLAILIAALLALYIVPLNALPASAATVGGFEIEGNLVDDSAADPPIDWFDLNPGDPGFNTGVDNTTATGQDDTVFSGSSKEYVDAGKERGRTVLLSSHILAEVERLCDRVSIIRAGRTVETGTLAELRHLTRTSVAAELASTAPDLGTLAGVHDLVAEGHRVRFEVDTAALDEAVGVLHRAGVRTLTATPPTLEELFLRHYGDEVPDPGDSEPRPA